MPSPNAEKRSDLPSPKRQNTEETTCDGDDSDADDSECGTPEEIQFFYDEWDKSQGFEIDFTKLSFCFDWKPLDLDDSTMVQTNRDFIAMLSNLALTQHNAERDTRLELVKVLRANFHPSAGATFYISFEVNDPSEDGNPTKPYRAVVRYLPRDMEVVSCMPISSSSGTLTLRVSRRLSINCKIKAQKYRHRNLISEQWSRKKITWRYHPTDLSISESNDAKMGGNLT